MTSLLPSIALAALLSAPAEPPAPPPASPGAAPAEAAAPGPLQATYLYSLSTNFGTLPFSGVRLSYDPDHGELYVTGDGPVRVFNDSGMEIYTFGDDPELGYVYNIASTESGELVALSTHGGKLSLVRCTFRGEFLGVIEPRGVPEPYTKLIYGVMRYAAGKIYLADLGGMQVLVLDATGGYVAAFDVAEKIGEAAHRADLGLRGFNVDREGNILFTIQPLFRAFSLSLEGELRQFGQKGGAPGKFNVVGGITRDAAGNYYVADILKSAILVFSPELVFLKEFGYRGRKPSNLAAPEEIVSSGDKLFVSQMARRGVSVFRVGRE